MRLMEWNIGILEEEWIGIVELGKDRMSSRTEGRGLLYY
jgi:hypothetical protein